MKKLLSDPGQRLQHTGLLVAIIALVLYLVTFCRGAYPVASSVLLTTHNGIDPFQSYQDSLWTLLLQVIQLVPFGTLAGKGNFLSVPLSVLSVWLMYYIVASIPHDRTTEETLSGFSRRKVGAISGFFAAAYLAVCPPFWFIATRAHPLTVHIALLLGCTALLVRFTQVPSKRTLYLFCLLLGIGMVQFPTLILLSPFFGLWTLYLLWKAQELRVGRVLGLVGLTLTGYASILLVAAWFMTTDTYTYRELGGMGELLLRMVKDQYVALRRSAPQIGWLSVMLFTLVPWFVVVVFPKRVLMRRQALVGSYLLHAVMVAVGLLILFNAWIAPFHILELRALLVTPYVFAASWMGYLAGYWHIMWTRTRRHEDPWMTAVRRYGERIHLPVLLLTLAAAAWVNSAVVSAHHGEPISRAARELVANLDGRSWLLTNGSLDSMIQLAAQDAGVELTLIDNSRAHLEAYRRYLSGLVEEPRLKTLIEIGIGQMLVEWANLDPDFHKNFAVMINADSWHGVGRTPQPAGVMFLGEDEATSATSIRDVGPDLAFFETMVKLLDAAAGAPQPLGLINDWLRIHLSKVANNTGYYLEEHDRPGLANQAYQHAWDLTKENFSALLNMSELAAREGRPEAEALAGEVERYIERQDTKLRMSSLAYSWGYVRNPNALYERGIRWAASGRPTEAIREIEHAVDLSETESAGGIQLVLAALHDQEGDVRESERLYSSYLEQNPDDVRALLGLARLEMRREDYDMARTLLMRVAELDVAEEFVAVGLASVELLSQNLDLAVEHLDRALEINPENARALSLRAMLAADSGDEAVLARCATQLEQLAGTSTSATLTLAQLALQRNEPVEARAYLDGLLERGEARKSALSKLLDLDVVEGRMDLGEQHVKALLQLDPRDPRGNLILGSILYSRGEMEQAKSAFEVSLEGMVSSQALNSLGWIQVESGAFETGRELAEKALALNPNDSSAWDTLGVALTKLDRLDEAGEALVKAVEISDGRPSVLVHLAELHLAREDPGPAREIAEQLLSRIGDLSEDQVDEVTRLLSRIQ